MNRWRTKRYALFITGVIITNLVAGCGVDYAVPEEYLSDGELLSESMEDAIKKLSDIPALAANGPYAVVNLDKGETDYELLFNRFEDALSAELVDAGIGVSDGEATDAAATLKYRLLECRIVNEKSSRGKVKRVGRTVVHVRIFDGETMVWAGEVFGTSENVVPKGLVSKLTDERVAQIGPQAPEGGKNPFIEPLLVTGITGALIGLFAFSTR